MSESDVLAALFDAIPTLSDFHAPDCAAYQLLRAIARREVYERFGSTEAIACSFGPFGELTFPYERMGAIDSLDLFGIDELVIFALYWQNRGRYHHALDLGANIGLHSILMTRCGFQVTCLEPDPRHFELLTRNLQLNGVQGVTPINAAVSAEQGTMEFVRVLGNTTGSHLAGSKANVYGETDRFPVSAHAFRDLLAGVDLVKLDIEGHEKVVLTATIAEQWRYIDVIAEIGSSANADAVFSHLRSLDVNMYAQRIGWRKVQRLSDMPTSYRDGSLFISTKAEVPW